MLKQEETQVHVEFENERAQHEKVKSVLNEINLVCLLELEDSQAFNFKKLGSDSSHLSPNCVKANIVKHSFVFQNVCPHMAHENALSSKLSNFFGLAVKESLNYGNEADIQGCVEGVFIDAIFVANKIIKSLLSRGGEKSDLLVLAESTASYLKISLITLPAVYDKISGFEVLVIEDKKHHPRVPQSKQVAGQVFDYLAVCQLHFWASELLCHPYYRRKNVDSMDEYWQFQ